MVWGKIPIVHSLCKLCQRIETFSLQARLHPSKCRCLANSYSLLIRHVLSLASSLTPSSSLQPKLCVLLTTLLHTLREGERFVQDCTYQEPKAHWFSCRSAQRKHLQEWLMNKALAIALSTEIFDVHLHDLLWCISTLIWMLADWGGAPGLDVKTQAKRVHALLKKTWASANEEDDVKSMQELFKKIGAQGNEQICNLICHRLSESISKVKDNLANAVVPTYLWMDTQSFENMNKPTVLGSSGSVVVFVTRLMGGMFARKHFHLPGHEEVFKTEAAVHARLRHANVVNLVCCTMEASGCDTRSNLVMQLMHQDLAKHISQWKPNTGEYSPFSLLAQVDLMLQIAKAMEYLHNLGIMHRDLKSANILVSRPLRAPYFDERGYVNAKIADFGTSKVNHDTLALYTTKCIGTGIWRAPEVVDEEDASKYNNKADVYSFAIVCSEILTGLPPDELLPCKPRKALPKILKEGRRPQLPSSCPPAIASYIRKCWHGDVSERPTFKQICTVFRFFKACILLGERELLASPLQDYMFDFEELQRTAAERQLEGMFYHPVLDIPSEMNFFRSIRERILSVARSKI